MDLLAFGLKLFTQLFVVINPIGMVAVFLGLSSQFSTEDRAKLALLSCVLSCAVILGFGYAGEHIFKILGVSKHDFQIAGGVLLAYIGFNMVTSQVGGKGDDKKVQSIYDIFVFPLSIPTIAGPGAMATVALAVANTSTMPAVSHVFVVGAAVAVMTITYLCFRAGPFLERIFGLSGLSIITRIFGVLLMTMAAQMLMKGLHASWTTLCTPLPL